MTARRTALVTGASAGIGRATALRLAEEGYAVVVHGRDKARTEQVAAEVTAVGGHVWSVAGDLGTLEGVGQVVRETTAAVGTPDVLVNNAGSYTFAPTAVLDEATFDAMVDVNLKGLYFLTAAFLPAMADRGSGAVVNVSSSAAARGVAHGAAYGATKAAVEALTRSWSAEFGRAGVRVNAVSPGPTRTLGTAGMAEMVDQMGEALVAGRAGVPEDTAAAIAFLVSDAASFVHGVTLGVDGGQAAVYASA